MCNLKTALAVMILSSLALIGCDSSDSTSLDDTDGPAPEAQTPPTPDPQADSDLSAQAAQESVKQMLALAKDGAWAGLIDGYYGEADKIPGELQKQALVERFKSGWGEKLIPVLEQAAEIKPVVEDGKAKFQVDGETIYELHLGDDGTWGFHL